MATPIDVVVQMSYNFFQREIGEIVHYLPNIKKKQNFDCLSNCRYCADRAQNLPWLAPNIWLIFFPDFIQIGSLSAEL